MGKPYPNCWGLQKSMVNLWDIIDGNVQKRKCIGNVFHSHRRDLNELMSRNLSRNLKKRVLIWMKHWYYRRVFEDIQCLGDMEKRHLWSAIMGHQREAHRKLHE